MILVEFLDLSPLEPIGGRLWSFCLSVLDFLLGLLPHSLETFCRWLSCLLALSTCPSLMVPAPPDFPSSGNVLWYKSPGKRWAHEFLPVGNGYLAAMLPGGTSQESIQLNIESLWSGGPFQDPEYNGGNALPSKRTQIAQAMQDIRRNIFSSSSGTINNIKELMADAGAYGSYAGAGYLLATLDVFGLVTNYARWLDLDKAIVRTMWSQDGVTFFRDTFCSHPTRACVQYLNSTAKSLPLLTYAFSVSPEPGLPVPNVTCLDDSTLRIRGYVCNPGMLYEILAQVHAPGGTTTCSQVSGSNPSNATLSVRGGSEAWVTWVGDTNYDMAAGTAAFNYSFKGPDPHNHLVELLASASLKSSHYDTLVAQHVADYQSIMGPFSLSLGQTPDFNTPTDKIVASYKTHVGNPYLEWLSFNFGRYLLASSARGVLPANLQGKWGEGWKNAWGADYHSNINIQMNYWFAEMTNMNVVVPLFDYFENTWAPRGAYTARVLYNSSGWVTHNEMNIFGHTGMKRGEAKWANYPEANAWMMIHAWDHFDYTNDVRWWKSQGYPLVKAVATFHLQQLVEDLYFNDSTLVTAPCNSPEQAPTTFGCAHTQQVLWQLFNAVEKGYAAAGDTDIEFLKCTFPFSVLSKRALMDKGLHVGSWGQLQEWKVDMDSRTDTHRHLSHLIGLYPGYAIASYEPALQGSLIADGTLPNYTKEQLLAASQISLHHRGNGTGGDADSGWEKVWRAACWAQLGNGTAFYKVLAYNIKRNWGPNLFDIYNVGSDIFQIDANFGYTAAMLNALLQAPDVASIGIPLQVTLLPALPANWPTGSIKGARIRGGITLDFAWRDGKLTAVILKIDDNVAGRERDVIVNYAGEVIGRFRTGGGVIVNLS